MKLPEGAPQALIETMSGLSGLGLIVVGVSEYSHALAMIIAGALLVAFAMLLALRGR